MVAWEKVAVTGIQDFVKKLAPYGGNAIRWFITEVGGFGALVVQFLLTVVFSALLYAKGEHAASRVKRFGRRLAGPRGEHSILLAGQAVRGVALGVVVTALAQSVLGGVGLAIARIPFAGVLTAVMFMLAIAQVGPGARADPCGGLALLERQHRLGHISSHLDRWWSEPWTTSCAPF